VGVFPPFHPTLLEGAPRARRSVICSLDAFEARRQKETFISLSAYIYTVSF
jgi:hypothetical protein